MPNGVSLQDLSATTGTPKYVKGSPAQVPLLRPLRQYQYDREYILSTASSIVLFADNKKNGAPTGVAKTLTDTNMPNAGQLGTPLEFDLFGFMGHLDCGTSALANTSSYISDFTMIYNTGVFEWIFGQTTTWLQMKLHQFPEGVAAHGFTGNTGVVYLANGNGSSNEYYNFTGLKKEPRHISSNESFRNKVSFNDVTNGNSGLHLTTNYYWTTYMVGLLYASL